jgi:hypothetical protein
VNQGDNLDIAGRVDWFPDFGAGANPIIVQHEVEADSVTKRTGAQRTVTPIVLTDGSGFVTRMATMNANAWNKFEATLISIAPGGSTKLQVTGVDAAAPYQFHTSPGNTSWGTNFRFAYRPRTDGGVADFPVVGDQFSSITGVVSTTFGGAVLPTRPEDFIR